MMSNTRPPQWADPAGGVDQALTSVLEAIGVASRSLALQNAISMARDADRQRLAVYLEAMTPDQLAGMADAAHLLSVEAGRALARRARDGCASPADAASGEL
ncbi:hypothetical protein AB0M50_44450 [Nonomuraea fuscirosea]|jgi:hypothetical protein|uniref:hypothetical protein n=1 Tax=Nonomuraea fuscirosea TaxID=1291556 RepID=UPI002DD90149|nr:hypothetical protein [Nonomuraea fuscirosea]WSA48540.1 hypothetical protein OIE67_31205 [Nonomuraea fuscirosea]